MNLAEAFPGKEIPWRAEKTSQFRIAGPSTDRVLAGEEGRNPPVEVTAQGTYTIVWNSIPSYIEIDEKEFNEYASVEGYSNVIELRKQNGQENSPGREKYMRFMKTFVQVGQTRSDHYSNVMGQKIEIIPLSNPYSVKAGSRLSVKVAFDGAPAAGLRVMATYDSFSKDHDVYAQTTQTNAEGVATFSIDKPGLWLIRSNRMLPLEGDPKADWQSFWANCTFEIR